MVLKGFRTPGFRDRNLDASGFYHLTSDGFHAKESLDSGSAPPPPKKMQGFSDPVSGNERYYVITGLFKHLCVSLMTSAR